MFLRNLCHPLLASLRVSSCLPPSSVCPSPPAAWLVSSPAPLVSSVSLVLSLSSCFVPPHILSSSCLVAPEVSAQASLLLVIMFLLGFHLFFQFKLIFSSHFSWIWSVS